MIGCIRCHGPLDGNDQCPMCDRKPCIQDNFDKLSLDVDAARAECSRTKLLWDQACQRLNRLEQLRNDAWRELTKERGVA